MARAKCAISVRELVEWTYASQMAHRGGGGLPVVSSISGTGLLIEKLMLGCRVSGGGCPAAAAVTHCDDDALAVHGLVEALRPVTYRLTLVRYGEARAKPDWSPVVSPLRVVPVPGRKGAAKGIYDRSGNIIGHEITYDGDITTRKVASSMRRYWPDAPRLRCVEDVVEHARRVYDDWWRALNELWQRLVCVRLNRWNIVGVGADCRPWEKY